MMISSTERKITQNLIYKALKNVARVSKSKKHQQELLHSKWGDDGSLLDVLRSYRNLVIAFLEVEFIEHS